MIFSQKKYKAKLKEELKKELLAEIKKEQIKERKKAENKKRVPIKINNSKEDLEEIRQKLFPAVILVVCMIIILILVLIYGGSLNLISPPKKNEIVKEEKDEMHLSLEELVIGEIPLNNLELRYIINEIEFKYADFVMFDVSSLFEKNNIVVSDLAPEQQLYLLGKTNKFNNFIASHNLNSIPMLCYESGVITIQGSRIEEIMKSEFNIDFTQHSSFEYDYFLGDSWLTNIRFKYENGIYYSECVGVEEQINDSHDVRVHTRVMSAQKTEDSIEFDVKVAFQNKKHFFSDYLLVDQIENPNNIIDLDYVLYGSDWKYIYKLNEIGDYYLYSIQNVTQAQ